ncbi:hypothetical protein EYV94_20705 [Puteibacter caeruleilacunae]|nr:hypothetical protein EYV94_20705 [Puteibacter caeruleilacunae]
MICNTGQGHLSASVRPGSGTMMVKGCKLNGKMVMLPRVLQGCSWRLENGEGKRDSLLEMLVDTWFVGVCSKDAKV